MYTIHNINLILGFLGQNSASLRKIHISHVYTAQEQILG
jgi:hypothetical protein